MSDGIYHCSAFPASVLAVFSSREFDARRDLSRFLERLGLASNHFSTVRQVHGGRVIVASPSSNSLGDQEADGIITQEQQLPLLIRTADCAPVFLHDPVHSAVGICHAGWRGVQKEIIAETLRKLTEEFGSVPADLVAAVGPAICQKCYEVGAEFEDDFPSFVRREGRKYFFDLRGAVQQQLHDGGVREDSVYLTNLCTACRPDEFFSARREGNETGRILSLLMLK